MSETPPQPHEGDEREAATESEREIPADETAEGLDDVEVGGESTDP